MTQAKRLYGEAEYHITITRIHHKWRATVDEVPGLTTDAASVAIAAKTIGQAVDGQIAEEKWEDQRAAEES